jgi:uncharacterized membrane protein
MAIRFHFIVAVPSLFLIIGLFAITVIILVPVTNTFSLTPEKPNGNSLFTDNANKSELTISENNSVLLKQTRALHYFSTFE